MVLKVLGLRHVLVLLDVLVLLAVQVLLDMLVIPEMMVLLDMDLLALVDRHVGSTGDGSTGSVGDSGNIASAGMLVILKMSVVLEMSVQLECRRSRKTNVGCANDLGTRNGPRARAGFDNTRIRGCGIAERLCSRWEGRPAAAHTGETGVSGQNCREKWRNWRKLERKWSRGDADRLEKRRDPWSVVGGSPLHTRSTFNSPSIRRRARDKLRENPSYRHCDRVRRRLARSGWYS